MNRFFSLTLAIFILLAAFYLDIHDLPDYPTGTSFDESVEVVDAGMILQAHQFDMIVYADGRSEILYRLWLALNAGLMGQSIFIFRLATVFSGILTIAAAGAAGRAFFLRYPPSAGRLALLVAMTSLAVNQNFMTLSRSLFRAIPAVLFTLLFLAFVWRGLYLVLDKRESPYTKRSLLIFMGAGLSIGLTMHTYTSALIAAALVPALAGHLLIFRPLRWRAWLPGMVIVTVLLGLFISPVFYLYVTNRSRVFDRADVVANVENQQDFKELLRLEDSTFVQTMREIIRVRYLHKGDLNPQYDAARAPLMPANANLLFYIALGLCLLFFYRYEAAQVLVLFAISMLPIAFSNEFFHGLRAILGLAVVPLLCGVAAGGAAAFSQFAARWWKPAHYASGLAALGLLVYIPRQIEKIESSYRSFFVDLNPAAEPLQADQVSMGEWYFRPETRASAAYITTQKGAVYMPLADVSASQMRSQLQQRYPHTRTWADLPLDDLGNPILPDGVVYTVVQLEQTLTDDFRVMVYLPPQGDTLYILPPLSASSASAVAEKARAGAPVRAEGRLVGHVYASSADLFQFSPIQPANGALFGEHLQVIGYTAPSSIVAGEVGTYCLIWDIQGDMRRNKLMAIQLWDYASVGLAGAENEALRWVYPTALWRTGDRVPICQDLPLPPDSSAGLYWLAVGVYERFMLYLPVTDPQGNFLGDESMAVAALKIPQPEHDYQPQYFLEAQLQTPDGETITLLGYDLSVDELGVGEPFTLKLYWQSTGRTAQAYTIFVHVTAADQLVAQQDVQPWEGRYPTSIWDAGEVVQTEHHLNIPAEAQTPLSLFVGMYSPSDFGRLPVLQEGQMDDNNRIVITLDEP